jgi:hypothetical protein
VIVRELAGEPPHLPGRPPSAQCHDANDCPPDFPGCESKDSGTKHDEAKTKSYKKNWLSLGIQQDFLIVGGQKGVCDGARGYACFTSNDVYYDSYLPAASGESREVASERRGSWSATTSCLPATGRSVRAGCVRRGRRRPAARISSPPRRGRVAYWFDRTPFEHAGVRPYVQVSGGIAQIDTKIATRRSTWTLGRPRTSTPGASRTGFASIGSGLGYAIGSQHVLLAELRLMQMISVPPPRSG